MDTKALISYVRDALIQQNGPSRKGPMCAYRGEDGRKCAAGWLIDDDEYHEDMEGHGLCYKGNVSYAGKVIMDKGYDLGVVRLLQQIHDMSKYNIGVNDKQWEEYITLTFNKVISMIEHDMVIKSEELDQNIDIITKHYFTNSVLRGSRSDEVIADEVLTDEVVTETKS